MPASKQPKRFAPNDLDNSNIAAGAAIATSKLADAANFILRGGSVPFTGDQSMGNNKLTNVATPASGTDAANKSYVDTQISNITGLFTAKGTVRAATTANITLSGAQTIDSVSVIAGDRVLVKNQSTPAQNGIYVAAAGSWARSEDMNTWAEVPGAWVTVQEGATNADTAWLSTANQGGTLDTTAITWINPVTSGSLTTSNFVFDETPSGSVNGSNTTFTVANTPVSGTLQLYIEGWKLVPGSGNDFTVSGATITLATAPLTGERLYANYIK
jgi:phage-related tail fiber protein